LGEGLYAGETFTESGEGRENHHHVRRDVVRLQVVGARKSRKKSDAGRPKPRSKCAMNTTRSPGSGAGTISPAGSQHTTPSGTLLVVVIQDMSAGVTSDPSQPERPWSWAELSSSDAEVAVMLEEAILVAGIGRESRSSMMLILSGSEKRGRLVSPAYHSHRS
jgi:hypothetical protein